MSDIKNMEKEDLILELSSHNIELHHSTGVKKLRETLTAVEQGTYKEAPTEKVIEILDTVKASEEVKIAKTVKKVEVKLTKEQRAMTLRRIIISPNDPLLNLQSGMIFTVGSSSVNKGRMIKKFVPFNNENGWHVPQIIFDQINNAQMQKFKTVKLPNGQKTSVAYLAKKFNVEVLPDLTKEEIDRLADAQKARGDA
ncbi:MAG: hypothetical protein U9O94_05900 [Nanoarchaeota archaeon]|nr:hypothetical protein [Nanoarchaeota archaeon]